LQQSATGACAQPLGDGHESLVHAFPSSQFGGGPPTQLPPEQASPVVQSFWSSHGAVLLVLRHPVVGSHVSVVQTLPSSQLGGGPPTQSLFEQVSLVVHLLPSSHGSLLATFLQPLAGSQPSSVQRLPSLQLGGGPPTQVPAPSQWSPVVHALPSLQGVVLGVPPSGGQAFEVPSQTSAASHTLVGLATRQIVPDAFTPSAGQSALVPLQLSATSHRSLAFRQTPPCANWSGGQLMLVPLQNSAASQAPAGARH
jgi:hypothetical protein